MVRRKQLKKYERSSGRDYVKHGTGTTRITGERSGRMKAAWPPDAGNRLAERPQWALPVSGDCTIFIISIHPLRPTGD